MLRSPPAVAGFIGTLSFTVLAIFGPLIVGQQQILNTYTPFSPPSLAHPFGTDYAGHDILSLLIYGTQRSVLIGFLAGLFTMVIGILVGLVAGYLGGVLEEFLMRVTDLFIIMPSIVLAIILVSLLGPSDYNIILAISLTSWMSVARIIRSDTLTLKSRTFVEAAKISGARTFYVLRRHILPNEVHMITSNTLLAVAGAVVIEAGLNFLGIGNVSQVSWGIVLYQAELNGAVVTGAWWDIVFPGLFITLFVLSVSLLGRGLERLLDPRGGVGGVRAR
jgi:peptide/nickel transport system permease protein